MKPPHTHGPAPHISVVLCTCNGGRYLKEQLDTIAQQTCLPEELVACDDCSTDDTLGLLRTFSASAPFSVRIFQNPTRLGSTRNFDKAIGLASGEFTALCDQDDRWMPTKLQRLSDILIHNPFVGGVFSDADLIDENSELLDKRLFAKHRFSSAKQRQFLSHPAATLLKHDIVTGSTLMFRTALRDRCQPIPSSWVHDGWLAWMISLYSQIGLTTEALTQYRVHAGQQLGIGTSRGIEQSNATVETRRQHYARVARQFEDLLKHILAVGWSEHDELVMAIREKIAFLKRQSKLSPSAAVRFWQILRLLPDYVHYARGLGSLRTDLLLSRESL